MKSYIVVTGTCKFQSSLFHPPQDHLFQDSLLCLPKLTSKLFSLNKKFPQPYWLKVPKTFYVTKLNKTKILNLHFPYSDVKEQFRYFWCRVKAFIHLTKSPAPSIRLVLNYCAGVHLFLRTLSRVRHLVDSRHVLLVLSSKKLTQLLLQDPLMEWAC